MKTTVLARYADISPSRFLRPAAPAIILALGMAFIGAASPAHAVARPGSSLNGDAKSELVSVDPNGVLRAFPNVDGINFNWGVSRTVGVGWTDPARVKFADLNGDGKDEVISVDPNGVLRAFPNVDGINFNWGVSRTVGVGWTDPARAFFADLNGDGRDEVISNDPNGVLRAFPNIDGLNFNWGTSRTVGVGWTNPNRVKFA